MAEAAKAGPGVLRLTNESGEVYYEVSRNRRLTLRNWKGKQLFDVREFYEKDGDMKPGRKGLSLQSSQWATLIKILPKISGAIKGDGKGEGGLSKNAEGDFFWELSRNKRVTVREWKGSMIVDLREYYQKNDDMLPGKKGISLNQTQWESLCQVVAMLQKIDGSTKRKSEADAGGHTGPKKLKLEKATSKTENLSESKTKKISNKSGEVYYELSQTRRLTLRNWKGKQLFDVREFYEKDGDMKPGRKGLSLQSSQWATLIKILPKISGAVKGDGAGEGGLSKNAEGDFFWELSRNKRVTVREWKGSMLVDLREYYQKNDDMLPGKKGISLNQTQWESLCQVAGTLRDDEGAGEKG